MDQVTNVKRYLHAGERVTREMPYSEVCMHMRVAGRVMQVEVTPDGSAAQLFDMTGRAFSFPVTIGEAGLWRDETGVYATPERCATVGCPDHATGTLRYPGPDSEPPTFERVCTDCGAGYERRPALRASFTPDPS